jgi:hypothetical protein
MTHRSFWIRCGNGTGSIERVLTSWPDALTPFATVRSYLATHEGVEITSVQYSGGKNAVFLDPAWSLLKHSPHEVGDQSEEHDQESRNPDQESGG